MKFPIPIIHFQSVSIGTLIGVDATNRYLAVFEPKRKPIVVELMEVAPFYPDEPIPVETDPRRPPPDKDCYVRGTLSFINDEPEFDDWIQFPCRYLHVLCYSGNLMEKEPQKYKDVPFKIVLESEMFDTVMKAYATLEEREADYEFLQRSAPHTDESLEIFGFRHR